MPSVIWPVGLLNAQLKNGNKKMVYLFIGQDIPSKDIALTRIKKEFLPPKLEDFNLDSLYADSLSLKDLQERLSVIPVKSSRRLVVIKNADELKKPLEDFVIEWASSGNKNVILVLDIDQENKKSRLINSVYRQAKIIRFKEDAPINTFDLGRQIESRRTGMALKTLNQLIREGERPERILGGLRYSLEIKGGNLAGLQRRIKLLLNCDIEIKTGRLKPAFALEKLVISLCALS